jgi:DNA primase
MCTERQLYLLKKFEKVVVVPDRDQAGVRTLRAFQRSSVKVDVLMLPEGAKDASDVQQGKVDRFKSVADLVSRGWLRKARPLATFDVDEFEKLLVVDVA